MAIGTNLSGLVDWSPEHVFTDVFKMSRPWFSSHPLHWSTDLPVDLDENGWVKSLGKDQYARTMMLTGNEQPNFHPAGCFVILYNGEGKIGIFPQKILGSKPGKLWLYADPSAGAITLTIEETNPANYIRDIRVAYVGTSACEDGGAMDQQAEARLSQKFNPDFVESIKSFRALRFMDWMATNNSKVRAVDDRPRVTDAQYTVKGAPVEVMVELANQIKADPWFTLPHLADDGYVRWFAEYVRDHLDKDRVAYVEYSNEVWNFIFDQAHYSGGEGNKLRLSSNSYEAHIRYYSRRSVQIFKVWEDVFGVSDRLVRVMGSQAANSWLSEVALGFEDAREHTDALAIAPYFCGKVCEDVGEAWFLSKTPDQILDEVQAHSLADPKRWLGEQKAVADRFGVGLIAYEGGQHLVAAGSAQNNDQVTQLLIAVNRHPRMKDIYLDYLGLWRAAGGGLFMHFVNTGGSSKWGSWGARETLTQPLKDAPKADALKTFMDAVQAK